MYRFLNVPRDKTEITDMFSEAFCKITFLLCNGSDLGVHREA